MIVFWIRKNDKGEPAQEGEKMEESFRKHDEYMKKFREDHPSAEAPRAEDAEGLESLALAQFPVVRMNINTQN